MGTNEGLRAHAMTRLAYSAGLRPGEIARIRMADLSFEKGELTVPERKGMNPARFPLPEEPVKAVAAYVIGAKIVIPALENFLAVRNAIVGGFVVHP